MIDKSKIKCSFEEFSTCITSIEEVSETAKEIVIRELRKLKDEIQAGRINRKKKV